MDTTRKKNTYRPSLALDQRRRTLSEKHKHYYGSTDYPTVEK